MGKALQKLGASTAPVPAPAPSAPITLLGIMQGRCVDMRLAYILLSGVNCFMRRADFVRSRLASGKIPNGKSVKPLTCDGTHFTVLIDAGAQLADFLRK